MSDRSRTVWRGANALYIVRKLGLTTGLKLVLDAGDSASYTSGQSWLDLSGNGYDFFLGANGSATSTDPTFTGTAGRLSSGEYWSFDGGDYFTYDTTNETWMQNLHKDNAILSCAAWMQPTSSGANNFIFGTRGDATGTGTVFVKSTGDQALFAVRNAGSVVFQENAITVTHDVPGFFAMSLTEGVSGFLQYNGTQQAMTGATYSSPATGNASFTMQVGAGGNAFGAIPNTGRMWMVIIWEGRAVSTSEMMALYQATRGRFGV